MYDMHRIVTTFENNQAFEDQLITTYGLLDSR